MAVVETLMHIRVTFLPVWLGISLSIPDLSQASPSQHFTSPEVVIPLKVISRDKTAEALGWLSYSLRFGGQRHVVHMKAKKLLVSPHLPVFTYTEQHVLHQDQPFVQDDCYYHGFVEGVPESLVALSTCSGGFQGMLQINELAYEIKPIKLSATFEHLVYKIDSDETQFPPLRCALTEEKIARQLEMQMSHNFTLKQSSYVGWWIHSRFLEVAVVVDYHRYVFSERNVTTIKLDIINVVNIVNSLYQALEIDIVLTGLEVWTTNNPINTSDDLDYVLDYFCTWKQNNLDGRLPYDVVHLFMKEYYGGGKLGVAYVGGACRALYNCGVELFRDNQHSNFAIAMSHELGHNLGMWHDERYCGCGSRTCIMNRYYNFSFRFSNCSYAEYWDNRRNTCIYSLAHESDVFKIKYCGNEVVDAGEECDCGSVQQCARNPCCQSNCTFSPGSSCSFGLCCKDCKFRPPGTLCRHPLNKCDLPEWCNGTSHQCPDDVYVQDGSPCSDNAYCYKKTCNTHDLQCKEIFGRDARSASQSCYNKINTQGNRFGHCDIVGTTYTKCSEPDIMCGRVQCENVSRLPFLQSHFTVHQLHFNQNTCWGTDYHLGMSIPDIGQVKEGTSCAPGKICISKKCASMVQPSEICQPETCNMRGVCNNKHHCHCNHEWSPPNCSNKGYGGSEDSGPPPGKPVPEFNVTRTTTANAPGPDTGSATGNVPGRTTGSTMEYTPGGTPESTMEYTPDIGQTTERTKSTTGNGPGGATGSNTGNAPEGTTGYVTGTALKKKKSWLLWLLILLLFILCLVSLNYLAMKKKQKTIGQAKPEEEKKVEGM
ncbi:disintegrin and metalloproteinase domain-containing protein 20-like [Marmota monax]|uniref:disintegrin and metalloproteinase domain-containing protein 20-like n=1 Tax=Marmota monax TaxID=9995 RepID=UPI001EB04640|nr:disintegrin and metalloproteinase domain-containing protein 20-like [Marmota monax]